MAAGDWIASADNQGSIAAPACCLPLGEGFWDSVTAFGGAAARFRINEPSMTVSRSPMAIVRLSIFITRIAFLTEYSIPAATPAVSGTPFQSSRG